MSASMSASMALGARHGVAQRKVSSSSSISKPILEEEEVISSRKRRSPSHKTKLKPQRRD